MNANRTGPRGLVLTGSLVVLGLAANALAQDSVGDTFLEEIIVTATKRAGGIDVQQAPVAVSAYGED